MRPADDEDAFSALRALYAEADALFADWRCPGAAQCCQFGITGREPQSWPLEWRLLERALRARPAKRAAAAAPGAADGDCPAFDPLTRRCRTYEARPFGCRTHFCERAEAAGKNPRAAIRDLARRLAALAESIDRGARLLPLRTWASRRR